MAYSSAYSNKQNNREPEGMQLYVGRIPHELTREDLLPMFEHYGEVYNFKLLKDKEKPGMHKGCAFLTYYCKEASKQAQRDLHEKMKFPGSQMAMQLKPSQFESTPQDRKCYVAMLGNTWKDDDVKRIFTPFGAVLHVTILRESNGESKGCAFVTYDTREHAQAAIDNLHHSRQPHCPTNIVVRFAKNREEKTAVKLDNPNEKQGFEVLVGFNPEMPMDIDTLIREQIEYYKQIMSTLSLEQLLQGRNGPLADLSSSLELQGAINQSALGEYQTGPVDPVKNIYSEEKKGPPGSNIIIHHLPLRHNEEDVTNLFSPFGKVISTKIFRERDTSKSKGFGFISYDNPESAVNAINKMHGFQIGEKKLQVRHKRGDRTDRKPY